MPRRSFEFGYSGTVIVRLDSKEYEGYTVGEIVEALLETVRAEAGVYDVNEDDIQRAAMALAGP